MILYFLTVRFVKNNAVSQALLLAASLYFYASWNPVYLLLIVFSVAITWASGLLMEKIQLFSKNPPPPPPKTARR